MAAETTPTPRRFEPKDPLEIATFWVAVLGFIAASAAAIFAERQAAVASDTEKRELRAYLAISHFGLFCADCETDSLSSNILPQMRDTIRYRIQNSGQTPASNVTTSTNWWPITGKVTRLPKDFAFPEHAPYTFDSESDIGRSGTKETAAQIGNADIRTFQLAAQGTMTLFLYGRVNYCDVFGVPHSTAYCFVYVPNAGDHLPLCDRYNGEVPARHACGPVDRPQ